MAQNAASPFRLYPPERITSAVVFASPHSGRDYPAELLRRTVLDERRLRSSEDAFVDLLLEAAPDHGATVLAAQAPRAWVDLNRAADELDPALIDGLRLAPRSPRVMAGLGVIPRVVAGGRQIYSGKITLAEAQARLDTVWTPYHRHLSALLDGVAARFGQAILIDVHSMPGEALDGFGAARPHIVLGDRFGAAAAAWVTDGVEAAFRAEGFRVRRNSPFAGAYITQAYGRPARNRHVIQVEIDRALYMDEAQIRPGPTFAAFARGFERVIGRIARLAGGQSRLAAE